MNNDVTEKIQIFEKCNEIVTTLKSERIFVCNGNLSIRVKKDSTERAIVALLNYTQWKGTFPKTKTYKVFFYAFDKALKVWIEERPPMVAILELNDREKVWYGCK